MIDPAYKNSGNPKSESVDPTTVSIWSFVICSLTRVIKLLDNYVHFEFTFVPIFQFF